VRIKFLQTTASKVEGFPFQAGQVIDVTDPPQWMLDLVDGVRAEAVKDDEPEYAVVRAPARSRTKRFKRTFGESRG
jgi:hypothetical protein